jgi:2-polyprenyl-6-hydroxyphenyl methylase/3-demethylubiquinone-9 3-methyltransferase
VADQDGGVVTRPAHAGSGGANVDSGELARFEQLAHRWWDPEGEHAALHALNPLRTAYVAARHALAGARVLDVGTGGGLLAESMAAAGADVHAIDAGATAIAVARLHAAAGGSRVRYEQSTVEALAAGGAGPYDCVTCMEMLEHVPDPARVVAACAGLLRPGGSAFFSTLNRNLKSYLLAVIGAEYVLGLLPRGTHDYARFLRPSELAAMAAAGGLRTAEVSGFEYQPLGHRWRLSADVSVNYILHAVAAP